VLVALGAAPPDSNDDGALSLDIMLGCISPPSGRGILQCKFLTYKGLVEVVLVVYRRIRHPFWM
jgi:hypothetical protein